ncbi:carboxypeptidase regulatory-like domain-containing protein [Myxococcus sp. Y35]|uniref:carboxypeptidase regulatory-like domain-containing protein n=1 Tax=Pseudomyxococcus flavus TaxID=3115648 RepID=UPI003CF7CE44
MNRKLVTAIVVLAAALAGLVLGTSDQGPDAPPPRAEVPIPGSAQPRAVSPEHASPPAPVLPLHGYRETREPEGALRLEGQVIDDEQRPVAGARVTLNTVPPRAVLTEPNGVFTFERLLPRTYSLHARHGALVAEPVETRLTPTTEPVILVVRPSATVEVSVLDADERSPIEGARITVEQQDDLTAQTNMEGKAQLRGLSSGRHLIQAVAAGRAPGRATVFHDARASSPIQVQLLLHRGALVHGRVVSEAGSAVADARVRALDVSTALPGEGGVVDEVHTGPDGRWTFGAVPAGTFRFIAEHDLLAPGLSDVVSLDGRQSPASISIVLREGAVLEGAVVERTGRPAPFARVQVRPAGPGMNSSASHGTVADTAGRFRITGLPRARFRVEARSDRASAVPQDVNLEPGVANVTLRLDVEGTISGVVVGADGSLLAGAQVVAIPEDRAERSALSASRSGRYASDISDGNGRFRLMGLAQGRYRLRGSLTHSLQASTFWLSTGVVASVGDENVRLTLQSPGTLRGRVERMDGTAPERFSVALSMSPPMEIQGTQGTFVLADVPAGQHVLTVLAQGLAPRTIADIAIEAGEDKDLGIITLGEGRQLTGVVLDEKGAPVPGASVLAGPHLLGNGSQLGPAPLRGSSDGNGRFRLEGGGQEPLTVMAEHPDFGRSLPVVTTVDTNSPSLELTLRALGSLEGTVRSNGQPVGNAAVVAAPRGSSTGRFMVVTRADGHYHFDRLATGDHVVTAVLQEGPTSQLQQSLLAQVGAQRTAFDIDVALGSQGLIVHVLEHDGQRLLNGQVYLSSGAVQAATLGQLETVLASRGEGQTRVQLLLNGQPVSLSRLSPGHYTLCVVPVRGDLDNPSNAQRLRDGASNLPVSCRSVDISQLGPPGQLEFRLASP